MVSVVREHSDTYGLDLLDMLNDVVFKSFFADHRNNKLLLNFLNAILHDTISSVELTDPGLKMTHADDKMSVMDIRVVTNHGEQINVEIQLKGHAAFPERMLMYWAKMYASQDKVGNDYIQLNKSIQIIITNFKLLPKAHFHSMFQLIDPEDGTLFSDHVEIHVIELPKLKIRQLKDTGALEKWLLFLKGNKQMKEALAMESSTMKEAFEEIRRLSEDPATRRIAEYRDFQLRDQIQREYDARKEGMEKGLEQGLEQGREQARVTRDREIVMNMHTKKIPTEVIAELTGIGLENVLRIIEENLQ